MTADVVRAEADEALLEMAERAHGSPFVLVELLSGLLEEQLVRVEDGRACLVEARLPLRVRAGMRGRLDRMSAPARQAATVAAVLGRQFSFDDLATMLGLAPSALLAPVDDLIRADLLIEDGEKLAFGHDITREAVLDSLPTSARRALGRQAATVLLAAGAMPVEVATLLAASAEPGDEVAITTLLKAAQALGASDPDAAADLGQKALELAPPEHPLRGPLVAETAVLLHAAGRGAEAKAFADTALRATFPPAHEAEVRLSIAGMFALSPDVRAEAGRQALALAGVPELMRARHLARLVHNLLVAGRPGEARELLGEAKAVVHASGDAAAAFTLELAEAGLGYVAGRFAASLPLVESAVRHGADANDPARHRFAQEWRGEWLAALDRLDESLEASAEGLHSAQRDRQGWAVRLLEAWRGRQLLQLGRLSDAAAVLEARFDPGEAHAVVAVQDVAGLVALGRVAIHTGDRRQHRRAAEIAAVVIDGNTPAVRRHAAWLLALLAMADGDPSAARAHLCIFGEAERMSVLPLFPMDVTDDIQLVRIALAAGDPELASSSVAAAAERSRRNPAVRSLAGIAAHARGLLDDDAQALAEAVELFTGAPRPLALASALEDHGRLLAGSGENAQAVEALGRALELYARAEASWDAGRVRGRLRTLGVRRRLVAAERPQRGWAAMTESELAVVRLVADGMTNREAAEQLYVSSHTVSTHLRHAFAKLGINSRVELTRLAIAHEHDG